MERTVVFAWIALALDEDATAAGTVAVAAGAATVSVAGASCAVAMVLGCVRKVVAERTRQCKRRRIYGGHRMTRGVRRSTICLRQPLCVPLACAVQDPGILGLAHRAERVCVVLVEVVRGSTRVTKGPSLGRHMSSHRSVH